MWTLIARDANGKDVARAELTDKPLGIGREKERQLVLPSSAVSRKHARIELRGGKPFLFDEGSANGTLLNGKRVVTPVELADGSIIEITPFKIRVEGPPAADEDERTVMIRRPAPPPRPAAPQPAAPPPPRPAAPPPAAPVISSRPPLPPAWTPPPPPPPKPPPKPVEEPKFIIPAGPAPSASSAPAAPTGDWDSAASELERQIKSVRSFREQSEVTQSRAEQLDQDWQKLIANLQQVKQRLSGNPRLLVFNFGRDNRDVTIKIEDKRQRIGYRYFLISRLHPDNKYPGKDSVWLRETGREDVDFRDVKSAQSELMQRIATTLA